MISSHPEWASYKEAPIRGNWFKRWAKSRFRYVDYPFLLSYRGYGNADRLVVQGHVFKGMAISKPRKKYTPWKNFVNLVKMFLIRTIPKVRVQLEIEGQYYDMKADENGFFEFEVNDHQLAEGWHEACMRLLDEVVEGQEEVRVDTDILIEKDFEYGCISDIDDTFLVSHVTKIWRKLYLLLTKNSETRKPFKGVVNFYKALGKGVTEKRNPFFYVSSSEWNLYDFLIKFMSFHKLPKGVLQLKAIREGAGDLLKSGFGSHDHKRIKIEKIFKMYPGRQFILLGDNGQHDPYIYHKLAQDYPDQVKAIYIRAIKKSHRQDVNEVLDQIREMDIPSLQFKHSQESFDHAKQHGFIR